MKVSEKIRESNYELLRIICMFMIIASHYSFHGGWSDLCVTNFSANVVIIQILGCFGKIACHIFIILTGYFMIKSKVKYKKVISLIVQMFFYSWIILICVAFFTNGSISKMDIIKSIFPIFWGNWFLIYYIILYLAIPFLNDIICKLDQKTYKRIIIFLVIVLSIIPTLTKEAWTFGNLDMFILMYLIGAYLRLYPNKMFEDKKKCIKIMVLNLSLLILSVLSIDFIGKVLKVDILIKMATYFSRNYSILAVSNAISIFLVFKHLKLKSKIINTISSSVLGVYLIHDNELLREYIWTVFSPNAQYFVSNYLIIHAIIKILLVFGVCLIIDKLRMLIFEKTVDKKIEKINWGVLDGK